MNRAAQIWAVRRMRLAANYHQCPRREGGAGDGSDLCPQDLLEGADEHTEAGGVEELDLRHVDDDLVVAFTDQLDELLAELRRRVDVDLPADLEVVQDVVLGAVYEGQYEAFIGLSGERPFTVTRLTDPTRVVIDIAHG